MNRPARKRRHRRAAGMAVALTILLGAGCTAVPDDPDSIPAEAVPGPATVPGGTAALDLAEQALGEGRVDDARTLLNRAVLGSGDTPRVRLLAAELHLASGAYRPAAAGFHALAALPDVAARALQGEGIALSLADGASDFAYARLRAAVARDPTLWRAWNALGYYYDSRADWLRAGDCYTRALAIVPNSAMILNNRGFSMLMQGRVGEALADLSEALRHDPASRPARENLRLALAWDGQYARALAGADGDGLARALNNVGYVALLRGDSDEAEAFLSRAIEVDPAFNAIAARNLAYLKRLRAPIPLDGPLRRQ